MALSCISLNSVVPASLHKNHAYVFCDGPPPQQITWFANGHELIPACAQLSRERGTPVYLLGCDALEKEIELIKSLQDNGTNISQIMAIVGKSTVDHVMRYVGVNNSEAMNSRSALPIKPSALGTPQTPITI